jgi:hypothetical protein
VDHYRPLQSILLGNSLPHRIVAAASSLTVASLKIVDARLACFGMSLELLMDFR